MFKIGNVLSETVAAALLKSIWSSVVCSFKSRFM